MDTIKIIVDTDIGSDIDDALCLAYLLQQPRCELLGITTCSSEPEKRAELADSVCRHMNREIPVFVGLRNPLIGKQRQVAVHQYSVVEKLPHKRFSPENTAIDFMKRTIEAYPHQVVLLAIGPMTNVGALFGAYPHLAKLVKCVAFMGGSFFAEGHAFTKQEWNILNDPYASEILFQSGAKIVGAGLDVSLRTITSASKFLQEKHSKVMEIVATYTEKFLERTDDMYYHDAIPVAYLFEPSIGKAKRGTVSVGLQEEFAQTRFTERADGNVEILYDLDVDAFFNAYFDVVNR